MPDNLPPSGWGPASFDDRDLDAVLAGMTADVPDALRPVADLLAALRAGPAAVELYGEAHAMAEFRALGLSQAGGQAPTMLLERPPAVSPARPGRQPARHRARPARRHAQRRAALRPAVLFTVAAAAVIVFAVVLTGNFTGSLRDIAHMASSSVGTPSATGTTGQSLAPRVEAGSAGLEPTSAPAAAHSAAPAPPTPGEICRAYYTGLEHPGPSAWATQESLWEQLTKLAHSNSWVKVYGYCASYVQDFFPHAQAPGQNQEAPGPPHPGSADQNTGSIGQPVGAPANSRPGSGNGAAGNVQGSNP